MKPHASILSNLAYTLVLPALEFLREHLIEIVATVDSGLIQAYINIMNYQFSTLKNTDEKDVIGKTQLFLNFTAS
jgi:hypothetical protein